MESQSPIVWRMYNRFGIPLRCSHPGSCLFRYVSPQYFPLYKMEFFFPYLTKELKQTTYRESETGSKPTGVYA
ncbi:MAG: hypothetical protein AB7S69_03045 [Salinivirgaceae bacterium]